MATEVREIDSIFSTFEDSAIFCSILRVTSCSTFSAEAPGHSAVATAMRTGTSGSLAWHAHVGVDAPDDGADQQHPRHLARLGEVAGGVALFARHLGVALFFVLRGAHGITCTGSPFDTSDAPMTTTRSPSARPARMGIWLP